MAAAYAHAEGGPQPKEIRTLRLIDRFGVRAVLDREYLGAVEMRMMLLAENILTWYEERDKASSFVEWQNSNPDKADMLEFARAEAEKRGLNAS